MKTTGVTQLPNEEYPIFSDFLNYIHKELYENPQKRIIRPELSIARANRLEKIELVIDNLVNSYAHLFNGHTSIPSFTDEQVIFFSVRSLKSLQNNIFNAQMFSALTLIWDNLIQIGTPQMKAMYEDENFNEEDALRFFLVIDESHRFINADNPLGVEFVIDYEREARKYFGGIVLASQAIRDYVPEHANTETVAKIRTLFELTQYKFIMQQDANTLDALRTIFEGQISESELQQIPQFEQGDCLLSINGVGNLMFTVEASEEEVLCLEEECSMQRSTKSKFVLLLLVGLVMLAFIIKMFLHDDKDKNDPGFEGDKDYIYTSPVEGDKPQSEAETNKEQNVPVGNTEVDYDAEYTTKFGEQK
ncbi:TraC family protein [Lysinibacillus sphaericus]|uniref:hypothetical protein n=1 Tax=Lysinibacillus sphaericus TaxID=1421 RepID=UPI001E4D84DF|nr:hypothetical protein [Lysinibacillus sphaericus]